MLEQQAPFDSESSPPAFHGPLHSFSLCYKVLPRVEKMEVLDLSKEKEKKKYAKNSTIYSESRFSIHEMMKR